jgi:RNA polymerase sigma-70 factor (ECF subfamily)
MTPSIAQTLVASRKSGSAGSGDCQQVEGGGSSPDVRTFDSIAASEAISVTEVSDELLMTRLCRNDKEALAVLFRRYARTLRGVAYRVLRDTAEADDLLQDIFLLVHRLCHTFDPAKGPARFWILQMTYRRAISRRRYLTTRHFYNRLDLEDTPDRDTGVASTHGAQDDLVDRLIGQEALCRMFEELSTDQRQTLSLYFFEGYTFSEIAAKLGQTVGNISHHYYRGLEKLRKQISAGKLQSK